MGFKPTLKYVVDTYGGEWTENTPPPVMPNGQKPGVPSADSPIDSAPQDAAAFAQAGDPVDPPAAMTPALDAAADPAMTEWVERFRTLVDQAQSLEDLRDRVFALAPTMSLDQYTTAMQQALAAAALAGRYELLQEAGGG
jgi:phage gp29-like protein